MAILDRNAQFKLELFRIELEMLDQKYLDDKRTRPNAGYIFEPTMQPRNITVNVCNHEEPKKKITIASALISSATFSNYRKENTNKKLTEKKNKRTNAITIIIITKKRHVSFISCLIHYRITI